MKIFKIFTKSSLLSLLLVTVMSACGGSAGEIQWDDDWQGANEDELFQAADSGWPNFFGFYRVPVCFRPFGSTGIDCEHLPYSTDYPHDEWMRMRALVQDALENSWQRWTYIRFVDFNTCGADLAGKVYVDLIRRDVGGAGCAGVGYNAVAGTSISFYIEGDEARARSVVIHEFGHALGFLHEQDRPDAEYGDGQDFCSDTRIVNNDGLYTTSYYDDVSIMNYCAPVDRNSLSAGDIEGAQDLFGISREGKWLKALPALTAFSL